MEEIGIFKEFGLSGLVIGALFYQNWSLIKELRAMNESTDRRIDEQSNRHAIERDKINLTLDKLANAFEKLYDKPCQTVNRTRTTDKTGG